MAETASEPEGAVGTYVVGPCQTGRKWVFLCPSCDEDRVVEVDRATAQCTVEWLDGQVLRYRARTWYCFQSDPFEGSSAPNDEKRFHYYSAVARLLGASGRRVELPLCVREKIEELHGRSETGFKEAGNVESSEA